MNTEGGFVAFMSSVMVGGISLAAAVLIPRKHKDIVPAPAAERPQPRPLRLLIKEEARDAVEPLHLQSADAATDEQLAAPSPGLEQESEPEVLFESFDTARSAKVIAAVPLVTDKVAQETPIQNDQGATGDSDADDAQPSPPSEPSSRARKGLFSGIARGVGRVLGVRRGGLITEHVSQEHLSAAPEDILYETLPEIDLDANATIIECPGEAQPNVVQFSAAGEDLSQQIEQQIRDEDLKQQELAEKEQAEREERERAEALEHQRNVERIAAETEGRARGEAWTRFWAVRLDPDITENDERARIKLASSLALEAPWAGKLIALALEQEPSERVRARLIGALARGGHRVDSIPFEAAALRSHAEAIAVAEALRPFANEAQWIAPLLERCGAT